MGSFVKLPSHCHRQHLLSKRSNEASQQIEAKVPVLQHGIRTQRYFSNSGLSMVLVFAGQNFLSVMMAWRSASWHGQLGLVGISGMVCATIALAWAAFLWRFSSTISTVTGASFSFQQS